MVAKIDKIIVPCSHCGVPVKRLPARIKKYAHQFCSHACTEAFQKGKQHPRFAGKTIPCTQCGTPLHRSPAKLKAQDNHFCNRTCMKEWRALNFLGENSSNWKGGMATVFCEYCDTLLERYQGALDKSSMFFCDFRCKGSWQSENQTGEQSPIYKKQEVPCTQCGTIILKHPSRISERKNQYCSRACSKKWVSENLSGPNSPIWNPNKTNLAYGPAWNQTRRAIRARDGYRCQHCGITEKKYGKSMDVHHIAPRRQFDGDYAQFDQPSNLIALCRSCHNLAEKGKIPIQPRLV